MKSLSLLDCTLRDGGYINDWEFGHPVITSTYKRLDDAGVDFIEVGFLDDRRVFDINRTIVPDTDCWNTIFENVEKKHAIPVAMIDYGTCSLDHIKEASTTFIDGIRVIFKKEKIGEALPFCQAIKEKGYKLFIQAISITAYSEDEMVDYIQKVNEIRPYAFSIVDTYGLLDEEKLANYIRLFENNLDKDIKIGYHAHNNFQLAFSNSIHFLGKMSQHEAVVDATVYGMGKSAGNCPIELISLHMNERYDKVYDINQFMEILDTDLMAVYQKYYWGYRYNFYISAMQNCHPNYVQFLLDKKTLSISSVNEILSRIPEDIKLLYDQSYIENAYLEYQSNAVDDAEAMADISKKVCGKKILLLGPGKSIVEEKEKIDSYIKKEKPVVIAINFSPKEYTCDYVFVSNSKRYSRLIDSKRCIDRNYKLVLTSNITPIDGQVDYMLNYSSLIKESNQNYDNALLLCLGAFHKLGITKVTLAGFDGFSKESDYYDVSYSFAGNESYQMMNNQRVIEGLARMKNDINVSFLTNSLYKE